MSLVVYKTKNLEPDETVKRIFLNKGIILQQGEFKKEKLKEIFSFFDEIKSQSLIANLNASQILNDIAPVNFPKLKVLTLNKNKIESVEKIHQINIPNLQFLILSENHIISISSLRKGKFEKLEHIDVKNNAINDGEKLAKMKMSSNVNIIEVEDEQKKNFQFSDLRFLSKIQSEQLSALVISKKEISLNSKVMKSLNKKFLGGLDVNLFDDDEMEG